MTDIETRAAEDSDAEGMCAVLNPIIEAGGSTAHCTPFNTARMQHHYIAPEGGISCLVAMREGECLGFQSLVLPSSIGFDLPDSWGVIASFVGPNARGAGVGGLLFAATVTRAREAGIRTLDATIRTDNAPGLAYYTRMGFTDYGMRRGIVLSDGSVVDQVQKRFDISVEG